MLPFWSYFDYVMIMWENIPGSPHVYIFRVPESLETRLRYMNNQRTTSPLRNRPRCYAKSHAREWVSYYVGKWSAFHFTNIWDPSRLAVEISMTKSSRLVQNVDLFFPPLYIHLASTWHRSHDKCPRPSPFLPLFHFRVLYWAQAKDQKCRN